MIRRTAAETLFLVALWIEALAIKIGGVYAAEEYLKFHKQREP